jgi:hypothetical protein
VRHGIWVVGDGDGRSDWDGRGGEVDGYTAQTAASAVDGGVGEE